MSGDLETFKYDKGEFVQLNTISDVDEMNDDIIYRKNGDLYSIISKELIKTDSMVCIM
jgi:hypothetical protein